MNNDCRNIQDLLVLHAEGELPAEQRSLVENHLASCARCREEASGIDKIRAWLADPGLFAPAQDYSWELLPRKMFERASASSPARRWLPANLGALGWSLSLAAMFFLACGLIWLTRRQAPEPVTPVAQVEAPGNQAFLRKIQSAHVREMTSQYLEECQDLLLNVVRAEKSCDGNKYNVSLEVDQARDLLRRKRLLDTELSAPEVARAKDLCDELEAFLIQLSTSEKCETKDRLNGVERFMRKEQLLLRIHVLQAELS
ncbi:MAG TPA: zf-HC2 domain-containing protein [Acidobacteriota bacterium]|nr:zf-HC2 domain-containing protein [Acidobacteriota bacterium]